MYFGDGNVYVHKVFGDSDDGCDDESYKFYFIKLYKQFMCFLTHILNIISTAIFYRLMSF